MVGTDDVSNGSAVAPCSNKENSAGFTDGSRAFVEGVRGQLSDTHRVVRAFDIGGTGVKTALVSSLALRKLLRLPGDETAAPNDDLEWLEPPSQLGFAPGSNGFAAWLLGAVPQLKDELSDPKVIFGIAVKGRIVHTTQTMRNWYAGGYSCQWGRDEPLIADIMGLPRDRTFALHDGSAHLLACSRTLPPPPGLALFALGTGVGFAFTDADGLMLDRLGNSGRHMLLGDEQVATASYEGAWRSAPSGPVKKALKRMVGQYGNMVSGRLGYEALDLAKAAYAASEGCSSDAAEAQAVQTYGEQWLHFLHTTFLPEFAGPARDERYIMRRICFAGGVAEHNWPLLSKAVMEPGGQLRAVPATLATPVSKSAHSAPTVEVLRPAPRGSGLIGAAI